MLTFVLRIIVQHAFRVATKQVSEGLVTHHRLISSILAEIANLRGADLVCCIQSRTLTLWADMEFGIPVCFGVQTYHVDDLRWAISTSGVRTKLVIRMINMTTHKLTWEISLQTLLGAHPPDEIAAQHDHHHCCEYDLHSLPQLYLDDHEG